MPQISGRVPREKQEMDGGLGEEVVDRHKIGIVVDYTGPWEGRWVLDVLEEAISLTWATGPGGRGGDYASLPFGGRQQLGFGRHEFGEGGAFRWRACFCRPSTHRLF